ncbi:MAG: metallophosphoesterase [Pseudomonadales bacterium]|nr:metallophosphoesterase [Pseudomonadales bacterium]
MRFNVIGDLHGYYQPYESLLLNAGIIDADLNWAAGSDQLWLIGDIFDRGNQAVQCLDLTIKLQQQAASAGGLVQCLLGNHELMFLAAKKFMGDEAESAKMYKQWVHWGGQEIEMQSITDQHISWLSALPAMALVGNRLLIHGDNLSYVNYGMSIDQVNRYFEDLMTDNDHHKWARTLSEFSVRGEFELGLSGPKKCLSCYKYMAASY